MVPYGGPVYRPPVQRVDPPSPREIRIHRRLALLTVLFLLAAYLLLIGGDSPCGYLPSGIAFAVWFLVKRFWKTE